MKFSAEQIAGIIEGEIVGNPQTEVTGLSKIEEGKEGTLSFLSNPKYEDFIYSTQASICIVNDTFSPSKELPSALTLIKVPDAYACFAKLLEFYDTMRKEEPRIEQPSFVSESATVGEGVYLGAFSYIGRDCKVADNVAIYPNVNIGDNVIIGEGTKIYAGATIYRDCVIGKNCTIHSGAVVGADGFGFAPNAKGEFDRIPQIGNVILEDNVDIGANTTVDRATMGSTVIRSGSKIDNLVQIGHNVEIGNNSAMAAQVGVAGSTKIGSNVMVGGQVGFAGHQKIGNRVMIAAQSGVAGDVKDGKTMMGSPAFESDDYKKSYLGFRRLPMILSRLKKLEDIIKELTKEKS